MTPTKSTQDPATVDEELSKTPLDSSVELELKTQLRERFFRAVNYISIQFYIVAVYTSILLTDYFLIWLIGVLLQEDINKYEIVAKWFDGVKIGLAIFLLTFAIIHGILSTISQIKLDWQIFRESDN